MLTPFRRGLAKLVQTPLGVGANAPAFRDAGRKRWPRRCAQPIWTAEKIRKLQSFYKPFTTVPAWPSQNRGVTRYESAYEMTHPSLIVRCLARRFAPRRPLPCADGGVLNGASFAKGQPVSPGGLVSIFGTGLVSKLATADTIPLSNSLGGVTVTFADLPAAPLLAVVPGVPGQSDDQINAQLPWEIGTGTGVST